MSYYDTFLADGKEMINEFGQPFTTSTGQTFLVMLSDKQVNQTLEAGGFVEQTSFTVKVLATTAAWTTADGLVGGSTASIVSGAPISTLAIGKKGTAGTLGVRIVASQYKANSAWVMLTVNTDDQ